ncbi:MAG TPA: septal ring lytic transglycosylase RlpA family protein [Candidatus Binatia bacterium]|nr:septal ring lytic transglycosylase RlpA family protein [Candidatus Binatia bacterium]
MASWYGPGFEHRRTASGETFDGGALTAAHTTLPLGSRVRVTNLANGRSVVVRINDRGPFVPGRSIDLSRAAARRLDMVRTGTARVRVTPIGRPAHETRAAAARHRSRRHRRPRHHARAASRRRRAAAGRVQGNEPETPRAR